MVYTVQNMYWNSRATLEKLSLLCRLQLTYIKVIACQCTLYA